MELIIRPLAGGKTLEAIKLACREQAIIICHTSGAAQHVKAMAKGLNYPIPEPMSYFEWKQVRSQLKDPIIFDNLDLIMQEVFGTNIIAATATGKKK